MKVISSETNTKASIYIKDNKVYKINDEFLSLTGYIGNDFLGKSLCEILEILKANKDSYLKNSKVLYKGYIFKNENTPKLITVTCEDLDSENKKIDFNQEDSNGFLRGVLSTCTDNPLDEKESSAVYSYPDMVHLKISDNYKKKGKLFFNKESSLIGTSLSFPNHILKHIKEKGYYYSEKEKFVSSKGITSYWTLKGTLIYGDSGAKFLRIAFIDDTDKVLTRKDLEEQKFEMETILNNIPIAVTKLDKKGNYTYTNDIDLKKFSHCRSDHDSLNSREIYKYFKLHDIDGNRISFEKSPDVRVLNGERLTDYILIATNDLPTTYYKCNAIPLYDELGNVESGLLIYENIESTFKIEEYNALAKNIETINVNYALISANDFKIQYLNEDAFESIKMSHPNVKHLVEVIGDNFFDYYAFYTNDKESLMANMKSCVEGKFSKYTYTEKVLEKGQIEYIKTIFQPVFDENNEVKQISCVGMYVTDEELEKQRMVSSLEAQEEIFTNTSHELKTPVNLIFSASQMLDIYLKGDNIQDKKDQLKRNNKVIIQNCFRSIKLINNILDYSRIEQGFYELKLENRDILSVLESMVDSVSQYIKDKHLEIAFHTDIKEKIVALDLYKFERIMLNLISNAIKFSRHNGVIDISLLDKGDYIEILVEDQGIGIDNRNLDSIFNKFKQENKSLNRRVEGTGIGLSLVKSIVEIHGGTISVESTVDVGTTFKITLPSKILDEPVDVLKRYDEENRVEMIKFELSDIYD